MGPTRRVGVITALALLGLAAVSHAEEAEYQCFSFGRATYPATIRPVGDINREVGSSYEAYCLFDPKRVNVSEVYFQHWGDDVRFKIPHEVLNNSAIKVVVQHDEMIDYKLKCMMTYKDETKFLCERKVNIGYPPQDVQNMTCISKNWEQLNCSWVEPPNPVRVQYILTYVVAGFRDTSHCPKNQTGKNWCFWENSDFSQRDEWILTFTAHNALKSGVQFKHNISVYETVIPKPAEDLTAHVEGPHSVKLSWKLPYPIDTFPGKIIQEVSYRERPENSPLEELEWLVVSDELILPPLFRKLTYNKTVDNLYAYMQYDFRVRLHTGTGKVREHMWSDAAVTTQETDPKLPTAKVRTDIGTFEIEQNVNSRDIYVNWQKIDFVFKNGPDFHYEVDVFDADSGRQINKTVGEVEVHDDYAKFINMENNMKFRFEITPVNRVGPGGDETKATVIVPEKSKVLTFPSRFQVIVYKDGNSTIYGIKWNITEEKNESQKIESVSIYWCKRRQYEERCLDKLDWVSVNPRLTMKNITDLEKETMYIFGISANSNKSSSGIKWITCIASHGNKLPPIDSFGITEVSSTEAELEWNLGCKDRSADPTGFNISYCITPRNETDCRKDSDMHYIAVSDASAYRINVTSLLPYTRYIFSIASQSELGMSRWSKSLILETSQDKPSGPPRNVRVIDKGQEWIYLAWNPPHPEERNGVIVTYKIKSEPAVNIDWPVAKNNSEVMQYNITGLEAYTQYKFKIVACTQNRNCGNSSVTYETRTGIGVPGPIEGIYMNDDRLQWNHDECNGPSCYYEIRYGPEPKEIYISKEGQTAVSLRDLGINCTEHNEKIQVEIRAMSQDSRLEGQWMEKSMKCPIPGSYSDGHVFRNSEKNKFFVVQYSPYNQYNTILNLLKIPYGNYNPVSAFTGHVPLRTGLKDIIYQNVPLGPPLGTQYYGPMVNSGLGLQGDIVTSDVRHEGTRSYEQSLGIPALPSVLTYRNTNLRQLISGSFNSPSVTRNTLNMIQSLDGSNQNKFRNYYVAPNDRTQTPSVNSILYRKMLPATLANPGWNMETGGPHDDDVKYDGLPIEKVGNKIRKSVCPIIKLMNMQGVEVQLNTSGGHYELNIKGHGGLHKVLKVLHCAHQRNCELRDFDKESGTAGSVAGNSLLNMRQSTSKSENVMSHSDVEREQTNENFISAVPYESFAVDKNDHAMMTEGNLENSSETNYSYLGEMSSSSPHERSVQPQVTRTKRSTNSSSVILKLLSQNSKNISMPEQNKSDINIQVGEGASQRVQTIGVVGVESEAVAADKNSRGHPYREESVIHQLGIMGNFNGNLGKVRPKNIGQKEFPSDSLPSNEISLTDVVDGQGVSSLDEDKLSSLVDNKLDGMNGSQSKTKKETPNSFQEDCLLDELSKSEAVKIRLKVLDNQHYEFNIQGPGDLFDILEKIYYYSGIDDVKSLDLENDFAKAKESQNRRKYSEDKLHPGYLLIPNERSVSAHGNEGNVYEAASSNLNYARIQNLNQNIHNVGTVSDLEKELSTDGKSQNVPATEFSDGIGVSSQLDLPHYIRRSIASASPAAVVNIPDFQTIDSTTELSLDQSVEAFQIDKIAEDEMKSQENYEVVNLTESGLQLENTTWNPVSRRETGS